MYYIIVQSGTSLSGAVCVGSAVLLVDVAFAVSFFKTKSYMYVKVRVEVLLYMANYCCLAPCALS